MKLRRRQQKPTSKPARARRHASAGSGVTLSTFGGSLLALESRIMFDGAAVPTVSTVTTEQIAQSQAEASHSADDAGTADSMPDAPTGEPKPTAGDQALFDALAAYDISAARQEILFLSPSVRDYQQLLDGISPNVEVIILDPARDGVAQIAEILAGRTGIDAIHLIGDGTEAEMHLGASFLTQDSISTTYAEQFQQIGQSLSADADLLIYGCNFGRGEAGQAAIQTLATLTGADVAASTDRTGHSTEFGDWILETSTGAMEASIVIGDVTQATWEGVLATYTVINTNDSGAGSLRQAIIDANANAGSDTIDFTVGVVGPHIINLLSALPTITDTVIIDATTQSGYAVGSPVIILDGTGAGAEANGFVLQANNSTIAGFRIQDFVSGTTSISGTGIVIDGTTGGGDNNTISQNYLTNNSESVSGAVGAISITGAADNNLITNNQLINNNSDGIRFANALSTGAQITNNVITGSGDDGVKLVGANITFTGNTLSNSQRLSAGAAGVELDTVTGTSVVSNNTITNDSTHGSEGGVWIANASTGVTVANNTITGWSGSGIAIAGTSTGICLTQNSISNNGLLGIDLVANGVTANDVGDGDAGANNLQNYPVLTSAQVVSSTQVTIVGTFNSTANSYFRIEFFSSTAQDGTGHGEGQTYLGFVNVTTDGSGNATFNTTLAATVSAGSFVSATATASNATFTTFTDTSEFAQNAVAEYTVFVDLNSGPTTVTTGPVVSTSTSTTNLVTNGNFGTVAAATPPAPWVESGTAGNGSVVLAAGDGRYNWIAGSAGGTSISQALTVPASTSNTTVSTTNTPTTTTVVTTIVDTADAITSIAFGMAWQNRDIGGANDNRLIVSYNGVTYATFETFEAGVLNAAGLAGTWTYSNGASGPATTASVANEATGALTSVTINLPAGVTASGSLVFRYTSGSTGAGSDDLAIDNVVATSTKTTITTVTTVTTTADTADNDWTATYTENGAAVSIADTDSSIFDSNSANMVSAAIALTNPATGDRLLVNNSAAASGTLASGIAWTRTDTAVTLSGWFTKAQYADAIELVQFENTTDTPSTTPRTISVTVNDGTFNSNTAIATINVTAVNDAPAITALADQTIAEDGTTGALPFTVSDVETAAGALTVTAVSSNTTLIPNGNLTLVDLGGGSWTIAATPALNQFGGPVTITVTVSDGTATTNETFDVTVTAVNDAPAITALADQTIAEDGTTGALPFTVSDVETAAGALTVTAVSSNTTLIPNGNLTLVDLGGGSWTIAATPALNQFGGPVTITVTVSDGTATTNETFDVTVTAVNDAPVVAANIGSTVARGGTDSITIVELQVTDVDNTPAQLTYTVTVGPVNGQLELTTAPGVATNSFTQAQIDAGQVVYVHNGSFTASDSVTFTVSDGAGGSIGATTFGITVTPVNSVPVLAVNAGSTVLQGTADSISVIELQVTDLDNISAQLTYTVSVGPVNGQLELTTAPGVAVTSFTQADINAGRLVFVHSGAVSASDSFTFTVSDGAGGTIGATTFNLTVTPFAPPPPPPPPPPPDPVPVPIPVPGPPGPIPGGVVPPVLPPPPVLVTVVGATEDPVRRTAMPSRTFAARVEQPNIVLDELPALELEPLSNPVKTMLAVGHKLAEHLTRLADNLDRAMEEREQHARLIGRMASFSGIALSAGFVAWLLHGGSLLTSFLVSMPAWRHFDPLPVLGVGGQDRRKRDRKLREEEEQENKQFRGLDRVLDKAAKPANRQEPDRARRPKT